MTSVSTPLSPSDVSMVCCGNTQGGSDSFCFLYSTSVHAPERGTCQLGLKAPDLSPQCLEHEHLSAHFSKARVQRAGKWVKAGAACLSYQASTCGPFIHNPDPTSCLDHYLAHQGVGRCLPSVPGHCQREGTFPECTWQCLQLSSGFSPLYYYIAALAGLCLSL